MRAYMSLPGALVATALLAATPSAGGTLTPLGSPDAPIQILDHHVDVAIQNGFARTEVTQVFFNPNATDLEALYAFPVPESASLSEMTIFADELPIHGEVVARDEARRIYEEERDAGNDSGLAEKDGTQRFEFRIARVPAQAESRFRFLYYQPLEIDTGVGRYLYPLEEGGTDEVAMAFWTTETQVQRDFSIHVEIQSAWPIAKVRVPGHDAEAQVVQVSPEHYQVDLVRPGGSLERDFVLYYRLEDDLPGRVEVVPYRDGADGPGTFMLVVTPGVDLRPLERRSDFVFVLDLSGSMSGKLATLAGGVSKALGQLAAEDRFRIVCFADDVLELVPVFTPATPENVEAALRDVAALRSGGGTNLHAGLTSALSDLDADRVTSVILVTDGVTNRGVVSPAAFGDLMRRVDVRVFGFLLGNGANWPLMRTICDASGGFYAGVSNADDVVGQILLAKSKVTHECLHDARLAIEGVPTHDTSALFRRKVYRGQQLVLFGRYAEPGPATVTLTARLSGVDKTYRTSFDFPAFDTENPEIERLWALDQIEEIQLRMDTGSLVPSEGEDAIAALGVAYQIVTDETSMLVLDDPGFERHGVERRNRERAAREQVAHALRSSAPARNHRVDGGRPAFRGNAPSSKGGGALDPLSLLVMLGLAGWAAGSLGRRP